MVETAEWASDTDVSRAERAKEQLTADAPDLNLPRAEAALARAQNRIKVADNLNNS